jgi:hypothetical protein
MLKLIRLGLLTIGIILPLIVCSCSKRPATGSYDIEFGKRLGPLSFDMTKAQIQDVLGKPSFQRDKVLNYNERGFTIFLNKKGTIVSIVCGSMDGDTNLISHFRGASNKGITLGALSEDIIKAYGQPTETRDDKTFYRYESLSSDFVFKDNRVICFVLRPKSNGQANER